jgi:hypothetical protein
MSLIRLYMPLPLQTEPDLWVDWLLSCYAEPLLVCKAVLT